MASLSPAAEFVALMKKLRWNQSETARHLHITPSHVNQIVNGKADPSAAMLQLLKLTAAQTHPEMMAKLGARPITEPDYLEDFWVTLRRRRLNRLNRKEQQEFVKAWSTVLGLD